MTNEDQILSSRAKSILKEAAHSLGKIDSFNRDEWEFSLEKSPADSGSDRILTLKYRLTNNDYLEILFKETLARLAPGKRLVQLLPLSFREAENFLRDQNHLPAFAADVTDAEVSFKKIKNSLLAAVLLSADFAAQNWKELSFVEKNAAVHLILEQLHTSFSSIKIPRLVYVKGEEITLDFEHSPVEKELLIALLEITFRDSLDKTLLKVIAAP